MNHKLSFFLLLILISFHNYQLKAEDNVIEWITFEELEQKIKKEPRKVFIDLYATWCGPCKFMDKSVFHHPVISKYMNEKYYAVKFNAEEKRTIKFKGHEFKYIQGGRGGINELTHSLIYNNGYPTVIFMNENLEIIQKFNFLSVEAMEMISKFIGENEYLKQPWEKYQKAFVSELK